VATTDVEYGRSIAYAYTPVLLRRHVARQPDRQVTTSPHRMLLLLLLLLPISRRCVAIIQVDLACPAVAAGFYLHL